MRLIKNLRFFVIGNWYSLLNWLLVIYSLAILTQDETSTIRFGWVLVSIIFFTGLLDKTSRAPVWLFLVVSSLMAAMNAYTEGLPILKTIGDWTPFGWFFLVVFARLFKIDEQLGYNINYIYKDPPA